MDNRGDPAADRIYTTRLTPYRSMTPRAIRRFIIGFCCLNLVLSTPFFIMGAWPVVGFFGLDVAAIYLAFRLSYRSARACEEFRLTYFELQFARVSVGGARREWRLPPAWVRLERVDDEEYGPQSLTLVSRGQSWRIARNVGPDRKAEFAGRFARALVEARRGPRYS